MEKELLASIIQISGQLKIMHWQTESYAEHVAFGTIYESLDEKFDLLIEAYSGKFNRVYFGGLTSINFTDIMDLKMDVFLDASISFFNDLFQSSDCTDLANIRDEIINDLNKLKYLLTLK